MQGKWLDIARCVACSKDDDEAANTKVGNLLCKLLVRNLCLLFVIAMHNEALESLCTRGVEYAVVKPRQKVADAVLANAVDALHICAVFALIAHEDGATHADDLQLVLVRVSVQEPRERL